MAGTVPVPQRRGARLGRHVAGRHVPLERVRPRRHDRQRVGVDDDTVLGAPPAGWSRAVLLRPDRSRFGGDVRSGTRPIGEPGAQGRLAPVRTGVLPPLPSGGPLAAVAGQRDDPYRVPLRGRRLTGDGSHAPLPPKRTASRRNAPGATARTVGAIRSHRGLHSSARLLCTARTTASATAPAGI